MTFLTVLTFGHEQHNNIGISVIHILAIINDDMIFVNCTHNILLNESWRNNIERALCSQASKILCFKCFHFKRLMVISFLKY